MFVSRGFRRQQILRQLLKKGREVVVAVESDAIDSTKSVELGSTEESVVRAHQEVLVKQSQIYSALLGSDSEQFLRRFGDMEDAYAFRASSDDQKAEYKNKLPGCFTALHRTLAKLNNLKSKLSPDVLALQRSQSLASFFAEYYAFCRFYGVHVLEFPVRKALGYCKLRQWAEASVVVRPFNQLRPLIILIAWDEFEDDFFAREELITHLWRNRPDYPTDPCSEPRLVQWCNRLDFNVQLISTLLEHISKANGENAGMSQSEKNDRAIRLLDTLRLHSILYTLRDYLPFLPARILLSVLEAQREPDVRFFM